ncbi:MAG: fibrinogen-like YCDxxxxGGGW domain-containing protein, partial [Polyangiales bacterium]
MSTLRITPLLLVLACSVDHSGLLEIDAGADTSELDSDVRDAGQRDASQRDAGQRDTGRRDAGVSDAEPGADVLDAGGDVPEPATCEDGILNGDETGTDCGGPLCARCDIGDSCMAGLDCLSNFCEGGSCTYARDCYALMSANAELPDGQYLVDLDGTGDLGPGLVQCDMSTEGGGWTLILNYLHADETNPELVVLSDRLPLQGSTTLGDDESMSATTWGHAGNALASVLDFEETMWRSRTSSNERVIHFVNNAPSVNSYIQTGTGRMTPAITNPEFTRGLAERNHATLPLHVRPNNRLGFLDEGDFALTEFPFYGNSAIGNPRAHWAVRGDGNRWESDNFNGGGSTHHQVWVRVAPCSDGVRNAGESDVDCGGSCGGCGDAARCIVDSDCLSGSCADDACVDAALATSCRDLLAEHAGIASGVYLINPADTDGEPAYLATCDMEFDGGGWTLIASTAFGAGPDESTVGPVRSGTTAHLALRDVAALGPLSQVHLRTHDEAAFRSVTTVADSEPLTRLLAGSALETDGPVDLTNYTGPFADEERLELTCGASTAYPDIYQSCGNSG